MPDLRQGCATGKSAEDTAPADALVLFGAMGDLAHKKIFPALYHMVQHGHLDVPVIGDNTGRMVSSCPVKAKNETRARVSYRAETAVERRSCDVDTRS
jgi:glucose-6-phosphate 1-dehydrogenase